MQTFARILTLLSLVISLIPVVFFFKRSRKNEEQRALPWYEKDVFWGLTFLSVELVFAVVLWIVSYKIV